MHTTNRNHTLSSVLLASLLVGASQFTTCGQFAFDSGSTGTNGALNITTDTTLELPPHGQIHCTTVTVALNATLKFTPNALNTPVHLLARGDVVINGTIDVSGLAGSAVLGGASGPGGFAGGNPASGGLPPGDGKGPGAGRGGADSVPGSGGAGYASYGSTGDGWSVTTNNGSTYGSPLLIPLTGGSGGGGNSAGVAGAGGGGALLIASTTGITVNGTVLAGSYNPFGYSGFFGFGSGGAIRLVAPVVSGAGLVDVRGGYDIFTYKGGGAGRIRIDCIDRRSLALNLTPSSVASIGANMIAIPTNPPRLDIIQLGTNNIPVGTGSPVFFMLPLGSDTNQIVTVQAADFGRLVPIRVVLTPENGSKSYYDTNIDNTVNPASVTVPVVVPVNVQVHVNAWTR